MYTFIMILPLQLFIFLLIKIDNICMTINKENTLF